MLTLLIIGKIFLFSMNRSNRPLPQEIPMMDVSHDPGSGEEESGPSSADQREERVHPSEQRDERSQSSADRGEEDRTPSSSTEEGRDIPGIKVLDVTYPPPTKPSQDSPSSDLPGLVNHRLQDPEDAVPPAGVNRGRGS